MTKTRRELYLQVLSEIRPMGGDLRHAMTRQDKKAAKNLKEALACYPSDWIKKSNTAGPIIIRPIERTQRAYQQGDLIAATTYEDMLHELAHRFEGTVTGIRRMERQFYDRRTAGASVVPLKGYAGEYGKKGNFALEYTGKIPYPNGNLEILSTGMEGLFAGSFDIHKDKEHVRLILGVLASL